VWLILDRRIIQSYDPDHDSNKHASEAAHSYPDRGSRYGTASWFARPQTRVEDDPDRGGSRSNS